MISGSFGTWGFAAGFVHASGFHSSFHSKHNFVCRNSKYRFEITITVTDLTRKHLDDTRFSQNIFSSILGRLHSTTPEAEYGYFTLEMTRISVQTEAFDKTFSPEKMPTYVQNNSTRKSSERAEKTKFVASQQYSITRSKPEPEFISSCIATETDFRNTVYTRME